MYNNDVYLKGSWKNKLKDRFKFLRRSHDTATTSSEEPLPKRRKKMDDLTGYIDPENFEEILSELKTECMKKKERCIATIQDLTSSTYANRRKWIKDDQPHVCDVLEMYPSLKIRKIVSNDISVSIYTVIIVLFSLYF